MQSRKRTTKERPRDSNISERPGGVLTNTRYYTIFLAFSLAGLTAHEKDSDRAACVKRQAELTAKTVLSGDYETLVKMTYRRVVDSMGGAHKLIAVTRKIMSELKDQVGSRSLLIWWTPQRDSSPSTRSHSPSFHRRSR
jgi:hypothetical protein